MAASTSKVTVSRYVYRGKNPKVNIPPHWRVTHNGVLQQGQHTTRDEAQAAADALIKRMTATCPDCGTNVIECARGREYINGEPALQCPCGTWVARRGEQVVKIA